MSLEHGANTLEFVARDSNGNQSAPTRIAITRLRTLAPTVNPPASPTNAAEATLTGAAPIEAVVSVNGKDGGVRVGERWETTVRLAEGANTFTISARENDLTSAPLVVVIVRDSIPPHAPTGFRSTPARDRCAVSGEVEAQWNVASDEGTGVAGYRYRWDTLPEGDGSGGAMTGQPSIRSALGAGRWYLHVVAIDGAGNVSPARHYGPVCLLGNGGTIAGTVFADLDADGRLFDEPGLAGWRVRATSDGITLDAVTDSDGAFRIEAPAGASTVCVRPPSGNRAAWTAASEIVAGDGEFCRPAADRGSGQGWIDFALFRRARLDGSVFIDRDSDGRRDRDEPGLAGVAVRLIDGAGAAVSATTGIDGAYAFDLPPGDYLMCAVPPPGMAVSTPTPDGGCVAVAVRSGHDVAGPSFGLTPTQ